MTWTSDPTVAWRSYIAPHNGEAWVEDGSPISDEVILSKRELFGLIVMAHLHSKNGGEWLVGYDPTVPEPNDGFITDGKICLVFEHKLVPVMEPDDVLEAIKERYARNAAHGSAYGASRSLIIQANKATVGAIRISDLRTLIEEAECPFDAVFSLAAVAMRSNDTAALHVIQHYPPIPKSEPRRPRGISQVNLNIVSGDAEVELAGIDFEWEGGG